MKKEKVIIKLGLKLNRHPQRFLLGIPTLFKKQSCGDSRVLRTATSGMTKCIARGFTLIELLVVVLIIGILAAVALPQYQRAVAKSRIAEPLSVLPVLHRASEVYYLANGEYTDDVTKIDVEMPQERIVSTWLGTNSSDLQHYYYSLANNGTWAANAASNDLPLFHFSRDQFFCITPKNNKWGMSKSDIAEAICKSIGVYAADKSAANGAPYYKVN